MRRYYNYALMRPANEDKPTVLHTKDEHGETTLLNKQADIYTTRKWRSPEHTWAKGGKDGIKTGRRPSHCSRTVRREKNAKASTKRHTAGNRIAKDPTNGARGHTMCASM